jgi:hypothetical protein
MRRTVEVETPDAALLFFAHAATPSATVVSRRMLNPELIA